MPKQYLNPASLAAVFRREFALCNVRNGETVVLLTELNTQREYVLAAFAAADELGAHAYEVGISNVPDWARTGGDLPKGAGKGVMEALKASDMVCAFFPPNFSNWQKEVRAAGTRVLSVGCAPDELARLLSPPGLKEAVLHAAKRWGAAREIRLLSDAGTDLVWRRGEFQVKVQYGFAEEPGRYDMWGAGHITNFPDEGSANGTVVLQPGDMWILPYVRAIESPVRLEVRDGFIRKVEGGLDAKAFTYWLDRNKRSEDDIDPYAVSHLGFGMHPNAHWDHILHYPTSTDHMSSVARVFAGNFLFSTGPNNDMGGKRDTKGHIDTPMCDCTVLLDNEVVLERGKFVDEKMIVAPGRG
jgi:2,5-dihydroxypyridine 5,6-dioxygenase